MRALIKGLFTRDATKSKREPGFLYSYANETVLHVFTVVYRRGGGGRVFTKQTK